MLTPEQREQRRRGIGSSDIPAIVGVSPHASPIDVYLDKLGLAEESESTETWCGDRAEAFIASLYVERGNVGLTVGQTLVHHAHPWALATPDRWRNDGGGGVEIKLVGARMLHLWADGVEIDGGRWRGLPAHVELQVQWQLEVLDQDRWEVAALLGGTDFRIYPVERDRTRGAELLEQGRRFWEDHVLARVPPPHTGAEARKLAQLRYPLSMGDMLPATAEAEALRRLLVQLQAEEKRLADERACVEARVMDLIGDADGIDGCFTWRRVGKAETWKAAARKHLTESIVAAWDRMAEKIGDDEHAWEQLARSCGADRLVSERDVGHRRFLVKRTKEERDGERAGRASALPRAEGDGDEADLRGPEEASLRAVPDEW